MRLNKEINQRDRDAGDVQKRFNELIMEPRTGTPEELQKIYETDVRCWRNIITEAKIQPNDLTASARGDLAMNTIPEDRHGNARAGERHRSAPNGRPASISPPATGWSISTA